MYPLINLAEYNKKDTLNDQLFTTELQKLREQIKQEMMAIEEIYRDDLNRGEGKSILSEPVKKILGGLIKKLID